MRTQPPSLSFQILLQTLTVQKVSMARHKPCLSLAPHFRNIPPSPPTLLSSFPGPRNKRAQIQPLRTDPLTASLFPCVPVQVLARSASEALGTLPGSHGCRQNSFPCVCKTEAAGWGSQGQGHSGLGEAARGPSCRGPCSPSQNTAGFLPAQQPGRWDGCPCLSDPLLGTISVPQISYVAMPPPQVTALGAGPWRVVRS